VTRRAREWLAIALVALVAGGGGYAFNVWRSAPDRAAAAAASETLLATRLPDLNNRPQGVEQWKGKVLVVNFWATWCAPCREEIPLFVKLQEKYAGRGLQFVGIAIDQPEKVRPFAAEFGMNFPILIGDADTIDLGKKLGNRAGVLPYTLIVGRDGKIVSTEIGAVKEAKLEALLGSLL
jgi:thiol-disulfide isomerase/thioredoxin